MLKGHAKIELTDVTTGEKQVTEHDNMITNAIQKEVLVSRGLIPSPAFCEAYNSNSLNNSYNNAIQLFGGMYLWKNALTTDADDYWIPADNELVGYSYVDAENSGVNKQLGSYSKVQSGTQSDGSYKHVWNFSTDQANGEIGAISLCPNVAGALSAGIDISNYDSAKMLPSGTYYKSGITNTYLQVGCNNLGICVDIDDDYAYFINLNTFNTQYQTDTSQFIGNNGRKIRVYRTAHPNNCVSAFQGSFQIDNYIDYYDIQMPDNFDISMLGSHTAYGIWYSYKGTFYVGFSKDNKASTLNIAKINIKDSTVNVYTVNFPETVKLTYMSWMSSYVPNSLTYQIVVIQNTLYAISDTSNNIVYCDLTDTVKGTISLITTVTNLNGTIGDNLTVTDRNNNHYIISNDTHKAKLLCEKSSLSNILTENTFYTSQGELIKYITISNPTQCGIQHGITCPVFVTTKNNLDRTITKTSSQSMTITYTLTPA